MKKTITMLVAALLVSAVGSTVFAGNSGVSDPTVTVTQFTTPDGLRDKTHASLDSLDAAIESTIDVLDGILDASGSLIAGGTDVGDTTNYTVLAANAGSVHIIPDVTADSTYTMPAEVAGMYYKFVYAGGAADAQDWIIDTGNDTNYFVGGISQIDVTGVGTNVVTQYYSDGNSNSKIGVLTPEAGTVLEMWCIDGTTWYVSGTVYSDTDTGVTFADQ